MAACAGAVTGVISCAAMLPFGAYFIVDGVRRQKYSKQVASSGIQISIAPYEQPQDFKTAMKHEALYTLLEKYNPKKPEKTLKKLETEIVKIDAITPAELKRRKGIEDLKSQISKTVKVVYVDELRAFCESWLMGGVGMDYDFDNSYRIDLVDYSEFSRYWLEIVLDTWPN